MSQRNVQQVIGRLVTDEAFRRRFEESPGAALAEMIVGGMELTAIELLALASIDRRYVAQFAEAIDPRIQKIAVNGGSS
ncbi:MAG: Os1348 family NHLP clan protein [Vicinamibacteria bacterium]